ncbi:MAG: AraC family transcriptional regulator [Chthonomonadales bacterium]|nr:AraC family transcriptional regulator [Chthonomonadales bacterium]
MCLLPCGACIEERFERPVSHAWIQVNYFGTAVCTARRVIPPHMHGHYEICVMTEGRALYTVDGERYRLDAGDLCLTKPGQLHEMRGADLGDWSMFYAAVEVAGLPDIEMAFRLAPARYLSGCSESLPLLTRVLDEARQPGLGTAHLLQSLMTAWLIDVARRLSPATPRRAVHSPYSHPVECARGYVERNACYRLSAEEVARAVGLSPSRLAHRFTEEMGVPLGRYVRNVLMQRALRLLEDGRLNVSQIANEMGFPSVHYFSAAFKRHWGAPPSRYVRRGGNEAEAPRRIVTRV